MALAKELQGRGPLATIPQRGHAVLENVKAALEIERAEHFHHDLGISGVIALLHDIEELLPPHGERVRVHGIDGDMRREVIELRAGARVVVRAHDDGDGGAVEMEEGVNAAGPGDDGHGAAGFEQLDLFHAHISHAQVRCDGAGVFKGVVRMDAGAMHDVKRAGELVLVDVRGAIEPEKELDVKARVLVSDELRLPKAGHGLQRLLVIQQILPHQLRELHVLARRACFERLAGDGGELLQ